MQLDDNRQIQTTTRPLYYLVHYLSFNSAMLLLLLLLFYFYYYSLVKAFIVPIYINY